MKAVVCALMLLAGLSMFDSLHRRWVVIFSSEAQNTHHTVGTVVESQLVGDGGVSSMLVSTDPAVIFW